MAINVELVKYDMDKTTKRKRKNLIVDEKSEAAVISKLEKIHKGEKVELIHEIIWGDEIASKKKKVAELYTGVVKFFNEEKGYGFISSDADEKDLFFHASAIGKLHVDQEDRVEFEVGESAKGPTAVKIRLLE